MVKGRKPDAKAVRRKHAPPQPESVNLVAEIAPPSKLSVPEFVAENATMRTCWNEIVGDGYQYTDADVPQLEQLCYWYAVYRQCVANTVLPNGMVVTKMGRKTEDGEFDPMSTKAHPDIKTAKEASGMFRTLAAELGVSPLARQKMGLMEAVTHSTQADLVRKTEDLFERFKGRLDAPK